MLESVKMFVEHIKQNWSASHSNDDALTLSVYSAIEEEFNSGQVKKGLLTKIAVESEYDDKKTKSSYIKARVTLILQRREEIAHLSAALVDYYQVLNSKERELSSLNDDLTKLAPTEQDLKLAKKNIADKVRRLRDELHDGLAKGFGYFFLLLAFGMLGAWLSNENKSNYSEVLLTAAILLSLAVISIWIGHNQEKLHKQKVKAEISRLQNNKNIIQDEAKLMYQEKLARSCCKIEALEKEILELRTLIQKSEASLDNLLG